MNDSRRRLACSIGVSYAGMMCLAIAVNLVPVFLTTLGAAVGGKVGLTNEQLGRIGAATFAGLVAGIVLTGPLADRFGAKPFAVAGNLLVGAGLAALGLARSYPVVLAAVSLMGLGAGVLDMVLSPIVCALQPERRTAAMNWLHSFYSVGAVGTILAGSLALRLGVEWRTLSFALILVPVLVGGGFLSIRVPPLVAEGQARMRLRRLCREPYFLVALAGIFLVGATELGMAQWLPAYAETGLGYTKWTGGMALMAFSIAMAVGRMGVGVLGARVAALRLMLACCAMAALLYVAASFAPWRGVALVACAAMGLAVSCLWPSMLGAAADRFPHGGGSMFGLLAATGNFGGIFMPWVVGFVADHSSLRWGLSAATVCPIVLAVLLVWMKGKTCRVPRAAWKRRCDA